MLFECIACTVQVSNRAHVPTADSDHPMFDSWHGQPCDRTCIQEIEELPHFQEGPFDCDALSSDTLVECVSAVGASEAMWTNRHYSWISAPTDILDGRWSYIRPALDGEDAPCSHEGGFRGNLREDAIVAVCCANHCGNENRPVGSDMAWSQHPGVFSIGAHDGAPCTFYEARAHAGRLEVCCETCWSSGIFLTIAPHIDDEDHDDGDHDDDDDDIEPPECIHDCAMACTEAMIDPETGSMHRDHQELCACFQSCDRSTCDDFTLREMQEFFDSGCFMGDEDQVGREYNWDGQCCLDFATGHCAAGVTLQECEPCPFENDGVCDAMCSDGRTAPGAHDGRPGCLCHEGTDIADCQALVPDEVPTICYDMAFAAGCIALPDDPAQCQVDNGDGWENDYECHGYDDNTRCANNHTKLSLGTDCYLKTTSVSGPGTECPVAMSPSACSSFEGVEYGGTSADDESTCGPATTLRIVSGTEEMNSAYACQQACFTDDDCEFFFYQWQLRDGKRVHVCALKDALDEQCASTTWPYTAVQETSSDGTIPDLACGYQCIDPNGDPRCGACNIEEFLGWALEQEPQCRAAGDMLRAGCSGCPFENDGTCDAPHICPNGTDVNDCNRDKYVHVLREVGDACPAELSECTGSSTSNNCWFTPAIITTAATAAEPAREQVIDWHSCNHTECLMELFAVIDSEDFPGNGSDTLMSTVECYISHKLEYEACPYINDGECDAGEICPEGTDTEDCEAVFEAYAAEAEAIAAQIEAATDACEQCPPGYQEEVPCTVQQINTEHIPACDLDNITDHTAECPAGECDRIEMSPWPKYHVQHLTHALSAVRCANRRLFPVERVQPSLRLRLADRRVVRRCVSPRVQPGHVPSRWCRYSIS